MSDGYVPFVVVAAVTELDAEMKAASCKAWVGRGLEKRAREKRKSRWIPEEKCIREIENVLDFMIDLAASL